MLPNGNLIRIGGVKGCNNCNPEVPEVYSPATDQWTTLSNNPTLLPMYPFTYVRPDGTVAVTGASEVTSALRIYDPATQTWTTSDPNVVDGGSAAMYDTGKVIKAGSATDSGQPPNPSAATAYTTDLGQATPTWTQTGSMAYPRSFLNLTPLPDGTVLATGGETTRDGSNLNNGVLPAEDWNPGTGRWTTWASMAVPRLYHSFAMLMPDGRVFVAGTGDDASAGVPNELQCPDLLAAVPVQGAAADHRQQPSGGAVRQQLPGQHAGRVLDQQRVADPHRGGDPLVRPEHPARLAAVHRIQRHAERAGSR